MIIGGVCEVAAEEGAQDRLRCARGLRLLLVGGNGAESSMCDLQV